MAYYLKLYCVTFIAFLVIDMVWLGIVARTFYQKHLGFLMAPGINWFAAILFYLLFIVGILVFVVVPGLNGSPLSTTLLRAALFGIITYSTYDLTNLSTIKDWPLIVTVIDIIWGMVLSLSVSFVSLMAGKWLS